MVDELFSQTPEVAILSLILKNPELSYDVDDLNSGVFSSSPNQLVFSTILDLTNQGHIPEYNLVKNTLSANGNLQLAGGEQYLKYLYDQEFNKVNFPEFKRLSIRSYKAKNILSMVAEVPDHLTSSGDVDGTIEVIRNKLDSLADLSSGETTISLDEYLNDAWKVLTKRIESPGLIGVPFGFKSVDNVTGGMVGGDLLTIGSRPSMGKSALVMSSLLRSAKDGYRPLLFSLEMNKQVIVERLVSISSGVSLSKIRLGTLSQEEIDKVKEAFKELNTLPIFIDTNFIVHPDYVMSTIRRFHNQKGITNVWIDYLQLLAERDQNTTNELGQITRSSKLLAEHLNIPITLMAQLNRGVELRDDKRPILSDIRQSGNIEEDSDQVVFLYRDDYYYQNTKNKNVLEYIIRKNRNGPVGTIRLKFKPEQAEILDER